MNAVAPGTIDTPMTAPMHAAAELVDVRAGSYPVAPLRIRRGDRTDGGFSVHRAEQLHQRRTLRRRRRVGLRLRSKDTTMAFASATRGLLPHRHRRARPRCRDGPAERAGRLPVDHSAELHAAVSHRERNPRTHLDLRLLRAEPAPRTHTGGSRKSVDGGARQLRPSPRLFHRQPRRRPHELLEANGFTFEMTADVSGSGSGAVRVLHRRVRHPHRDRRPRAVSRLSRVPAVGGGAGRPEV